MAWASGPEVSRAPHWVGVQSMSNRVEIPGKTEDMLERPRLLVGLGTPRDYHRIPTCRRERTV